MLDVVKRDNLAVLLGCFSAENGLASLKHPSRLSLELRLFHEDALIIIKH